MPLHICPNPQNVQHRMHLNVNYGLWVVTMSQSRSIDCHQRPALVEDTDSRRGCVSVGTLCSPLSLPMKLKLL